MPLPGSGRHPLLFRVDSGAVVDGAVASAITGADTGVTCRFDPSPHPPAHKGRGSALALAFAFAHYRRSETTCPLCVTAAA